MVQMVEGLNPGKTDLRSVRFPEEFRAGARNAVTTCLRIQPNEKVTLITDEATQSIAAAIAAELVGVGCRWNAFVLEELAERPLKEMPEAVLEDMETSEVSIFAVEVQPNELAPAGRDKTLSEWDLTQKPGEIRGRAVPMEAMMYAMSNVKLGRQIVDHTGLKGAYNFDLIWTPDEGSGGADNGLSDEADRRGVTNVIRGEGLALG